MNMTSPDFLPSSQALAQWLQTLGQSARLEILLVIGAGEACVCHLEAVLGQRQAYISQHLMALRQAGIISTRRDGRYIFYRLNDLRLLEFVRLAASLAGVSAAELPAQGRTAPYAGCLCPHCEPADHAHSELHMERPDATDPVG